MLKKLPIGIQTFKKIREGNYCYVDKTGIAFNLIDSGTYYFLSRPRRFGKSLFLDTLSEIFKGSKELFEGLSVYTKWDWNITYPIIKIDFGKGSYQSPDDIKTTINYQLRKNGEDKGVEITPNNVLSLPFSELIEKLHKKYKQKVVILIDEYDKPIIDNISNRELAITAREILSGFYSAIKSADEYIKFVFMTGVSKFSRMNLFSSLNNVEDITVNSRYSIIAGYTQSDLENVFADYLHGIDLEKVKKWYNGYNYFGEPVYNPYDILLFLRNNGTFNNYWWETGNPAFLIEMLKKQNFNIPKLESITVSSETLNSFDVDNIELAALLWQTGYLTFDKKVELLDDTLYKMKVPNLEIQKSLNALFANYLTNLGAESSEKQISLYQAIVNSDFDEFHRSLNALFASIPYNNYVKNNLAEYEGYYASVVFTFLASIGFDIIPEDVTSKGRIDLTLKTPDSIFIMEFKVDSSESPVKQIQERKYYEKYLSDQKDIFLVGINFDSTEKQIGDFSWERL